MINSAKIKPSANRMLVRHIMSDERVESGLVLPDNARRTHCKGRVVAIGSKIDPCFENAVILIPNYSSPDFVSEGHRHTFVSESDVIAVLDDDTVNVSVLPKA